VSCAACAANRLPFSEGALVTFCPTGPIGRIDPQLHEPVERGMRPPACRPRMTVLDRIEVNVIAMPLEIALIPQGMFPVPPLPDAAFAFPLAAIRYPLACLDATREERLDQAPPRRIVCISRRQGPDSVQMVRQDHDRIERERMARPHIAKSFPQQTDSLRKQARAPVSQVNREEEASAGNEVPPIVRHRQMLERPSERKQADRWVSPGLTHPTTICQQEIRRMG
jgi:hypothetical protein